MGLSGVNHGEYQAFQRTEPQFLALFLEIQPGYYFGRTTNYIHHRSTSKCAG